MGRLPTITVIICARNAAEHLKRSVPAALAQDYPPARRRILVVDNGSTDGSAVVARELGARVRNSKARGIAAVRNHAWQMTSSDLIAWLDADCLPPSDWLTRMASLFVENREIGAAGVRLVSPPPSTLAEEHIDKAGILDTDRFWSRNALQFPFLVTAGMVVRRKALAQIDGFDSRMGTSGGEDADLCWRLERAGWTLRYEREVEVFHYHRSTIRQMIRQAHWYGRGSAALFARWRQELGWWRYTDWGPYRRVAGSLTELLPSLLKGKTRYDRYRAALELLDAIAFLSGKWRGSAAHRVLFL